MIPSSRASGWNNPKLNLARVKAGFIQCNCNNNTAKLLRNRSRFLFVILFISIGYQVERAKGRTFDPLPGLMCREYTHRQSSLSILHLHCYSKLCESILLVKGPLCSVHYTFCAHKVRNLHTEFSLISGYFILVFLLISV